MVVVLGQSIFMFVVEYFWLSLHWHWLLFAPSLAKIFILTPIAFLASCMDPNLQLVVFSVVNKIWRVMIPCACILYSNTNIKNNAWILGSIFFYLEHYPIYQYFILSIGIWFFILFWYHQLVSLGIWYLLHRYFFQLILTFVVEYLCSSSYWLLCWIALFIAKCI